jgi:hypothetical protein
MGRETVKKLADLKEAAELAGTEDLTLPPPFDKKAIIDTVGAFQKLALAADQVRALPSQFADRTCLLAQDCLTLQGLFPLNSPKACLNELPRCYHIIYIYIYILYTRVDPIASPHQQRARAPADHST